MQESVPTVTALLRPGLLLHIRPLCAAHLSKMGQPRHGTRSFELLTTVEAFVVCESHEAEHPPHLPKPTPLGFFANESSHASGSPMVQPSHPHALQLLCRGINFETGFLSE
jgi:hypothetical protein